ncbi:dienelactone hydrolase family protein [Tamaricihabitans halophyticus]|uniref:Dienelactone hydrolase family protein n=1 Tax=Tamaricihabitans halophyticus TaxID=1262583 RepID=A0A4R2QBW7_9PSEU|nr:dienelactone hydrolase family protein [Tamaricihabitans halophyticus]TCP45804.1 dienelactone hydrolase family protein [Tamaricihabitans halophyticus]
MTSPTAAIHHHSHGPANRRKQVLETAAPLFVVPPQPGPVRGGVVVLHDLAGLTEEVERCCRWLAAEGWLAVAPYHYYESGGRGRAEPLVPSYARHPLSADGLRTDVVAAVDYLVRRRGLPAESLSVLGFGTGGHLAGWAGAHCQFASAIAITPAELNLAGMPPLSQLVPAAETRWLDASARSWAEIRRFLSFAAKPDSTLAINADSRTRE